MLIKLPEGSALPQRPSEEELKQTKKESSSSKKDEKGFGGGKSNRLDFFSGKSASSTSSSSPAAEKFKWSETTGELSGYGSYWIKKLSLSSIGMVTSMKVDSPAISELNSHYNSQDEEKKSICFTTTLLSISNLCENEEAASVTPFDACKEFRISELEFVGDQRKIFAAAQNISIIPCHTSPIRSSRFRDAFKIKKLRDKIRDLRFYISDDQLSLFPDFQQRLAVLRSLAYVEADSDTVTMKGRVACEQNTCDELLAAEIIFNNILEPLNPPECVGILSALICQEKSKDSPPLTQRMEIAKEEILYLQHSLISIQDECGVVKKFFIFMFTIIIWFISLFHHNMLHYRLSIISI